MYLSQASSIKPNKYLKWYEALIRNAVQRETVSGYSEKHHIVPKSMGGSNAKSNIVLLSGREHFIAHALLARCTTGIHQKKMEMAVFAMIFTKNKHERYKPRISKLVEAAREKRSLAISKALKGRANTWIKTIPKHQRTAISVANANRKWTEESKRKASESAKQRYNVPHIWITNGDKNLRIPMADEGLYGGWVRGKTQRKVRSDKGKTRS